MKLPEKGQLGSVIYINIENLVIESQPFEPLPEEKELELKESIKEIGLVYPIVVKPKDNGKYAIRDGRHRYRIAKELGYTEVPCIVRDSERDERVEVVEYDVELFRRHLSPQQQEIYKVKRDETREEVEREIFNREFEKIIPELQETVKEIYERRKDIRFVQEIASIPREIQKTFITEKEIIIDADEYVERIIKEKKDIENELRKQKDELEGLRRKEKEYTELEKKYKLLESNIKGKIDKHLREKEAELEEKYKEKTDNLPELIEEERLRIHKEYEKELDSLQKELREMSLSRKRIADQVDILKEEMEDLERQKKHREGVIKYLHNEREYLKEKLKEATQIEKITNRLGILRDELKNMNTLLLETGGAGQYAEKIKVIVNHMKETISELGDTLDQIEQTGETGNEN